MYCWFIKKIYIKFSKHFTYIKVNLVVGYGFCFSFEDLLFFTLFLFVSPQLLMPMLYFHTYLIASNIYCVYIVKNSDFHSTQISNFFFKIMKTSIESSKSGSYWFLLQAYNRVLSRVKTKGSGVNVLLTGPKRCGKTTLALVMKQILEEEIAVINIEELLRGGPLKSPIKKLNEEISKIKSLNAGVLLIHSVSIL